MIRLPSTLIVDLGLLWRASPEFLVTHPAEIQYSEEHLARAAQCVCKLLESLY